LALELWCHWLNGLRRTGRTNPSLKRLGLNRTRSGGTVKTNESALGLIFVRSGTVNGEVILRMTMCPYCGSEMDYLTTAMVAHMYKVSQKTVRDWIKQGRFPGYKEVVGVQAKKVFRIPASAVVADWKERYDPSYAARS
jgi:hypothetical protein